ncbi:hypothetical protein FA048_06105 [Pedobacter polaris]|uniref:Uncharacterized protein n=1 Tax=Pedobacter polaris TaxID=2571273 RepID=A0A4U1D030_9SPHI|nr:hypothetical protein FA048_06105 [Pedobacter polaris]
MILLAFLTSGYIGKAQQQNSTKVHVGLIYPISSNGKHAVLDTNNLSINLLAGVSSVEKGFAFAGVANIVRNDTYGTQFAGFYNHIGQKANGALLAGFANTYHEGDGAAFAGFANIAHGNLRGVQFAGFTNVAMNVNGAQFAGFLNKSSNIKGPQMAGFMNIAKNASSSQLAGFMNKAKDVKGSQFAGFINIARKVKGTQIAGFINIADSSDFPIGILNFVKNGEKSIGLSADENQTTMLTFRSGGRTLYGILGVGYNFKNEDEVYAFEAGFGAHFFQSSTFRLNVELTGGSIESFKEGEYFKTSFKLLPALKLGKHLEIFGGPALNFVSTNTIEGKALNPKKHIEQWQNQRSDFQQTLYVGYGGGINIIF